MNTRRRKKRIRPQIVLALLIIAAIAVTALGIGIYKIVGGSSNANSPTVTTPTDIPDNPIVDDPIVDEPIVDEPVVDEPIVDEPIVDEPVVDEPVDEPSVPVIPERPKVEGETVLTFVAVGDNLIHDAIIEDAKRLADERGQGERYYFDSMYSDFASIFKNADISFVNQESMIAGDHESYKGYPHFNTPPEMGETLERLGIDVVSIATNHALDLYGKGLSNCINYFKNTSMTAIGAYESRTDYNKIRIIEREGVKIAFLAYTDFTNEGLLGDGYESITVARTDHSEIKRQVAEAKELADLVFVSMHWGTENSFNLSSSQKNTAQVLVDAGVDVIIGHHPHLLQEMKWKDRPDGGRTLIAYSLGNFMSTMHPVYDMFGGMLTLDIVKNENGAFVENVKLVPTMTHYSLTRDSLHIYKLEDYSEALYKTHGTSIRSESAGWDFDRIIKTVKDTIPDEFLEDWIKER